jgi:acetyl esterase/lipase
MRTSTTIALLLSLALTAVSQTDRFSRTDRNGDGRVTPDELRRPLLFRQLDTDGDGAITRGEATGALRDRLQQQQRGDGKTAPLPDPAMVRHPGLAYAEMEGVDPNLLSLDLHAPKPARNCPVLVMIHGGGWCIGDKANANVGRDKARFFVAEGFVYISINYRLSPAVRHPAHVQDVARALAWVHDHVATHGGDPGRIVVMGHSAGAHLAALVATDERRLAEQKKEPDILKGVILLDGAGYDLPRHLGVPSGPALRGMFLKAFGDDPAGWKDPSPQLHVAAGKGIPPFLIFHAGRRRTAREQSRALAEALEKAGVAAKIVHAPDRDHGGMNACIGRPGDPYTEAVMVFLGKTVATPDR